MHEPVDRYTTLLPVETCKAALNLQDLGRPMGIEAAAKQVKILIGSYSNPKIAEPETYVRALASVLAKVAQDIGSTAIDRLTLKKIFLPSRAELVAEIEAIKARRRGIAYRARLQLEEHARRRAEREYAARVKADRAYRKEAERQICGRGVEVDVTTPVMANTPLVRGP